MRVRVRQGLDLPFGGAPAAVVEDAAPARSVALMCPDHPGLSATLLVEEGSSVARGQPLFVDRRAPAIRFTAPRAGRVARVHRDARRALLAVELAVEGQGGEAPAPMATEGWDDAGTIRERLLEAGLWPALRERPFGRIPRPEARSDAIFLTLTDSNPGAGEIGAVLPPHHAALRRGTELLAALTDGAVHVCADAGSELPAFEHPRV